MTLQLQDMHLKIGNAPICKQLTCHFAPGEIWGIVGKNGSGKTHFLHTLAGLSPPDSGIILLNERPLSSFSKRELATSIGLLVQENETSFPITVFDAVLAGRYPHLRSFQRMDKKNHHYVHCALETLALQPLATRITSALSGGEKQRTHIATLLTQRPTIYLLDEPLNHLDINFRTRVLNHFYHLAKVENALVIMVLHDIHVVKEFCDKILLMQGNNMITIVNANAITAEEVIAIFN